MTVIHGGDVWREALPEDYLDFSANLNPEGPPQWVREALALGLERARFYPDLPSTNCGGNRDYHIAFCGEIVAAYILG